jgi:hypothetical protein
MDINGLVQNGVVIFPEGQSLPEGMRVTVSCSLPPSKTAGKAKHRISLPLVPSVNPGTLQMTAERVAELLEEPDVSS